MRTLHTRLKEISRRHALMLISLFFVAIIGLSFFPFFAGSRLFINVDATLYYYPVFNFYGAALQSGESFLWNPLIFSGFPTYVSQSAGFLDPVNLALFSVFDSLNAYNIRLFLDLFLTIILSYVAARAFGLSRVASSLVGAAYLAAFNWGYVSNLVIANSLFLTPFLFWVGVHMSRDDKYRGWWAVFAGTGIGWSLLAGYAQLTIYAALLFGIFVLTDRIIIQHRYSWRDFLSVFAHMAIAALIAAIVGLPQLLPALDFATLTVRAQGLAYELTTAKVINPGDSILFLFPDYLYFPYLSSGRRPLYVGALFFFFALISIFALIKRLHGSVGLLHRTEQFMCIVSGLLAFCFAVALAHSPLFHLLNKLPVLSYFRFPYRWMYIGAWFLAVLGAYGFDYLRTMPKERWLRRLSQLVSFGVATLTALVVSLNFFGERFWIVAGDGMHAIFGAVLYGRAGLTKDPAHYRDAIERGIAAWQSSLSIVTPGFFVPFAILVAAAIIVFLVAHGRLSRRNFTAASFAISAVTLPAISIVQWPNSIGADVLQSHAALMRHVPAIDVDQYRTFQFMLGDGFALQVPPQYVLSVKEAQGLAELQFASGWPNLNMYAGVPSVDGYDPFVPTSMLSALEVLGSTHGGEEVSKKLTLEEKQDRLINHLGILGMMSGKYIISGVALDHPALVLVRTALVTRYDMPLYIYENAYARPKIYLAEQIKLWDVVPEWETVDIDSAVTHLECTACEIGAAAASDSFDILSSGNGSLIVQTHTRSNRWFVFGESYLPGWEVVIDGFPTDIVRANNLYMAVMLPAGEHMVEFTYVGVKNELRWLRLFGLVQG